MADQRKMAPHVARAIQAAMGKPSAQPPSVQAKGMAPHVARAVQAAMGKDTGQPPEQSENMEPHVTRPVQAAIAPGRGMGGRAMLVTEPTTGVSVAEEQGEVAMAGLTVQHAVDPFTTSGFISSHSTRSRSSSPIFAVQLMKTTTSRDAGKEDAHPKGGSHKDVKAFNRNLSQWLPQGYARESNHVPPKSVYPTGYNEDILPAHSIWKFHHRVERGEAGGGATSTGSSTESKEYREKLKDKIANEKFWEAMVIDINDIKNTAQGCSAPVNREFYNKGLLQAAQYAQGVGLMDLDELALVNLFIMEDNIDVLQKAKS